MNDIKYTSLLPELINEKDDAYAIVEDLRNVLEVAFDGKEIKNIALTGPYGSGKSSILKTLKMVLPKERCVLELSLATLRVDDTSLVEYQTDNQFSHDKSAETITEEELNRKIEYSILQQLIYRERIDDVPNTRMRRIKHIPTNRLCKYSLYFVLFILAFFIAFEPSWGRIDSLYNLFGIRCLNLIADMVSVTYMLWGIFEILRILIPSYANSKLDKLNLKDGVIELSEDTSIFNRHLDEILYFFQATNYDVVFIEDLDRFGTSKIFLKLRELNFLLNASKAVERHIVFLYAVKDDIFKDEERAKFFDYISTVIPIINPSNSKAKLKKALEERGLTANEISDDDLSEMAFFIKDMRILKNIANEYTQYRQQLCSKNQQLNHTKLLAMIVYKNYHPQDFALLHHRQGKIYDCFCLKPILIKKLLSRFAEERKNLDEMRKKHAENQHLQVFDLRMLLLYHWRESIGDLRNLTIHIQGEYRPLRDIANDDSLFEEFKSSTSVVCRYDIGYSQKHSINFESIDKEIRYSERLIAITTSTESLQQKEKDILSQESQIKGYALKELLYRIEVQGIEEYANIGLSPIMEVFLRLGYIDEDYYDYISYFYEGMITQNDHDLLLAIKQRHSKSYATHIDKIDNFFKELKPYMFDHKSILNNDLVDYIIRHDKKEEFERIAKIIEVDSPPLEFLAQYYFVGKDPKPLFQHFITWDARRSWEQIESHEDNLEREILTEAWLRYSDSSDYIPASWINASYDFLLAHIEGIGRDRCYALTKAAKFECISSTDLELLNCVINSQSYVLTLENLSVVVSHLVGYEVQTTLLNYSWCLKTNNDSVIGYVDDNLSKVLMLFSAASKREEADAILSLLHTDAIDLATKTEYLSYQKNRLTSYINIEKQYRELAFTLFLIEPTWENVIGYFDSLENNADTELDSYINHYHTTLSASVVPDSTGQELFEEIVLSERISDEALNQLIHSFPKVVLDGIDIQNLDEDRLRLLLRKDKIPFSEKNTKLMIKTLVFTDYLTHYPEEAIASLSPDWFVSQKRTEKLLLSNSFNAEQKRRLLGAIPPSYLSTTTDIANEVIRLEASSEELISDKETLIEVIKASNARENRVIVATKLIRTAQYDDDIEEILNSLGDVYSDIASRNRHPLIEHIDYNGRLLKLLQQKEFISSYKYDKEKNAWRVYPPRS